MLRVIVGFEGCKKPPPAFVKRKGAVKLAVS